MVHMYIILFLKHEGFDVEFTALSKVINYMISFDMLELIKQMLKLHWQSSPSVVFFVVQEPFIILLPVFALHTSEAHEI